MGLMMLAVVAQVAVVAMVGAAWPLQLQLLAAAPTETLCETPNNGFGCANCSTRIQCALISGKWVRVGESRCAANTYCQADTGSCSATVSGTNCGSSDQPTVDFDCPDAGYWPDLVTCTKYYLCVGTKPDLKAYAQDCSIFPGTVFDQRTTRCIPRSRGQCFSLRCNNYDPNKPTVYTPYTPAPWIFGVCRSRDAATALIGTCPVNQAPNPATGICEDACNTEGRFKSTPAAGATADDGTNFYECADLGGNKLSKPVPSKCPAGSNFVENVGCNSISASENRDGA